jgi:hypothetical protein
VEVLTARDERAAFSVFTLLRGEPAIIGPPGDWYCQEKEVLTFSRGNYWVRLWAVELPDLMRRVALSVGNRIGPRRRTVPSLISHLPQKGLNSSSIRYFVGERSFIQYSGKVPGLEFKFGPEMEVAQASYEFQSQSGMLSLISFPTVQMAQEFFDQTPEAVLPGSLRIFTRRVGPLVGVLAGGFEPAAADTILGGVKFSYTIKWIYDKNNNSSKTIWGVPVKILGTVVRSLLLTSILCVGSVFFGVGIAMFRILLRGYAPGNYLDRPERTEMIRLRLSDKPQAIPEDSDRRLPGRQK